MLQERRKFGPLGFNIRYEFNDSDLETSRTMLRMFLDDQDDIPWDAMLFITGHINYGGRVTDDWDRRCLLSILRNYYSPAILEDGYKFSASGLYYAPSFGPLESYREYVDTLPLAETPELFGLHSNANITFQRQQSISIVETILSVQPRVAVAAGGKSPDELVMEAAMQLKSELPKVLVKADGKKELFKENKVGLLPSMSTVLLQELEKFNRLLRIMKSSLKNLTKAIKGLIIMSEDLDKMYVSIQNNRVPKNWEKVAYPSLKPLSSWYKDLQQRVSVLENWLKNGNTPCYWISGFFFPQGFLTGVLQTHARKELIAIDKLAFSFKVLEEEEPEEVEDSPPTEGVYIYGFFMDGARWERETQTVVDQLPGEMYDKMPIIHFKPVEGYKPDPEEYSCPAYKTSVRAGVLSTTGQSTNFILPVELPTKEPPRFWILRATALLCMLDT